LTRKLFALLGTVAAAAALSGCPPPGGSGGTPSGAPSTGSAGGVIPIGFYGDLSGSTASFGTSTKEGVELALEEVNKTPPLGRPIELRPEDDQGKSEQSNSVVTKLVESDRVVAVIGNFTSSSSLAAAPICQRNKIPMLSPGATNVAVTQVGDYIFRDCFIDPYQGFVMAKFALENLKAKKAAILWDVKNDYSKGLKDAFHETFTKMGGRIVSEPSYSQGDSDFNAQLNTIKAAAPDVIFVPGYYTEVGTIARQARDQGIKVPLLGGDGWDSPKLFESAGTALEGAYFSNHYSTGNKDPRVQSFIAAYKAKYGGKEPDAIAALGYDALKMMADAITRAKSTDGPALRDALAQTKDFPGVTGDITIDENRNAKKPAVVLQIKGQSYQYVATVAPSS
jgi:branched-chain amino acid transport system substrate-binding protein